jgi:hypothetical protein
MREIIFRYFFSLLITLTCTNTCRYEMQAFTHQYTLCKYVRKAKAYHLGGLKIHLDTQWFDPHVYMFTCYSLIGTYLKMRYFECVFSLLRNKVFPSSFFCIKYVKIYFNGFEKVVMHC